jgi:hypothetical protein
VGSFVFLWDKVFSPGRVATVATLPSALSVCDSSNQSGIAREIGSFITGSAFAFMYMSYFGREAGGKPGAALYQLAQARRDRQQESALHVVSTGEHAKEPGCR